MDLLVLDETVTDMQRPDVRIKCANDAVVSAFSLDLMRVSRVMALGLKQRIGRQAAGEVLDFASQAHEQAHWKVALAAIAPGARHDLILAELGVVRVGPAACLASGPCWQLSQ